VLDSDKQKSSSESVCICFENSVNLAKIEIVLQFPASPCCPILFLSLSLCVCVCVCVRFALCCVRHTS